MKESEKTKLRLLNTIFDFNGSDIEKICNACQDVLEEAKKNESPPRGTFGPFEIRVDKDVPTEISATLILENLGYITRAAVQLYSAAFSYKLTLRGEEAYKRLEKLIK